MPAIALCALALLAPPPGEGAATARTQVSGYVDARGTLTLGWSDNDPEAPPLFRLYGVPARSLLTEGNVQLRVTPAENYDFYADLSLFFASQSAASGVAGAFPPAQNLVVPSELYANLGFTQHLTGLVGRKRLVFGSGFAWNPTDILNPPKDPTDPTYQRAGAWMVRVEAPFERFTLTALWAPKVTVVESGLPGRFLTPPGGGDAEQIAVLRLYLLVADTDVNLMWFWSNRYADATPHNHRLGVSFSRYFFRDYELHAEALVQAGRDVAVVRPSCLVGAAGPFGDPLAGCVLAGVPAVERPYLTSSALYARVITGTRYTFPDESLVSAEYFYNGTGLAPAQFDDLQRLLGRIADLAAAVPPATSAAAGAAVPNPAVILGTQEGQPAKFTFAPLRRHYLFLVYQKPKIREDFTFTATIIAGLEDRSGLLAPALSWSARDWLVLSLFGYLPFGPPGSEFGSAPFRFRAIFEVRAYY